MSTTVPVTVAERDPDDDDPPQPTATAKAIQANEQKRFMMCSKRLDARVRYKQPQRPKLNSNSMSKPRELYAPDVRLGSRLTTSIMRYPTFNAKFRQIWY